MNILDPYVLSGLVLQGIVLGTVAEKCQDEPTG